MQLYCKMVAIFRQIINEKFDFGIELKFTTLDVHEVFEVFQLFSIFFSLCIFASIDSWQLIWNRYFHGYSLTKRFFIGLKAAISCFTARSKGKIQEKRSMRCLKLPIPQLFSPQLPNKHNCVMYRSNVTCNFNFILIFMHLYKIIKKNLNFC